MKQEIDAPDFAVPQGEMMILRVPAFPFRSAGTDAYPALAERELPFDVPCESKTTYSVTMTVPARYEVARLPEDVVIENDTADLSLTCEWDKATRTIHWRQTAVVKAQRISVEEYDEFKTGVDALISPKNGLVLLQQEG